MKANQAEGEQTTQLGTALCGRHLVGGSGLGPTHIDVIAFRMSGRYPTIREEQQLPGCQREPA